MGIFRKVDKSVDRIGYWYGMGKLLYDLRNEAYAAIFAIFTFAYFLWEYAKLMAQEFGLVVYVILFALFFLSLIGLMILAKHLLRLAGYGPKHLGDKEWTAGLERVEGQVFRQERVDLDEKSFHNCTFDKCTLAYQGGRLEFVNNTITGPINFDTDSAEIGRFFMFVNEISPVNKTIYHDGIPVERTSKFNDNKN